MQPKESIQMVDVIGQYNRLKSRIDASIAEVLESGAFINGPAVKNFAADLGDYLGGEHVIPCGNGTDALQIALMALDLQPGDKVMVPAFTYVATAEVIALLGLQPVMVDVDPKTFNLTAEIVEAQMTEDIKAIVPVHLYGQCAEMEPIMHLAEKHGVYVVEDNAQAIGADYKLSDGNWVKSGTVGHIGCTSFYPSKNLGAYGDGGAIYTGDAALAKKIKMIANHGQSKKYVHDLIGCNSRLDSIQAAILNVKLKELDDFCSRRQEVADIYDAAFINVDAIDIPYRSDYSSHVFHQYTIKVKDGRRDELKAYLQDSGIPSMIYYPIPLYEQQAFSAYWNRAEGLPVTEALCTQVISLPIHTEMKEEHQDYIITHVKEFFKDV